MPLRFCMLLFVCFGISGVGKQFARLTVSSALTVTAAIQLKTGMNVSQRLLSCVSFHDDLPKYVVLS